MLLGATGVKAVRVNILVKLSLGVDFTNDFRAAFLREDLKSTKIHDDFTVLFPFWD